MTSQFWRYGATVTIMHCGCNHLGPRSPFSSFFFFCFNKIEQTSIKWSRGSLKIYTRVFKNVYNVHIRTFTEAFTYLIKKLKPAQVSINKKLTETVVYHTLEISSVIKWNRLLIYAAIRMNLNYSAEFNLHYQKHIHYTIHFVKF